MYVRGGLGSRRRGLPDSPSRPAATSSRTTSGCWQAGIGRSWSSRWLRLRHSNSSRAIRSTFRMRSIACAAPEAAGEKVFVADEYSQGHLDWYNFEMDPARRALGEPAAMPAPPVRSTLTMLPTAVTFNGMPNTRHWAFEDGRTNFGDVKPDTTDLGKLLLLEIGLIYANDWFIVPFTVPSGSVVTLRGLTSKDKSAASWPLPWMEVRNMAQRCPVIVVAASGAFDPPRPRPERPARLLCARRLNADPCPDALAAQARSEERGPQAHRLAFAPPFLRLAPRHAPRAHQERPRAPPDCGTTTRGQARPGPRHAPWPRIFSVL
jgi:hypothetical protein